MAALQLRGGLLPSDSPACPAWSHRARYRGPAMAFLSSAAHRLPVSPAPTTSTRGMARLSAGPAAAAAAAEAPSGAVSRARPPWPREAQDRALGGPPAPERAGNPTAVTRTQTARPSPACSEELAGSVPNPIGPRGKIWKLGLGLGRRRKQWRCHRWVSSGVFRGCFW